MTETGWPAARAALTALLEGVDGIDQAMFGFPATGAALVEGTSAVIVPPARYGEREGTTTEWTYAVPIHLVRLLGSDSQAGAALLDGVAERVMAALETSVLLGGSVAATDPPAFDDASIMEYPPESGVWFSAQTATLQVVFVVDYARGA